MQSTVHWIAQRGKTRWHQKFALLTVGIYGQAWKELGFGKTQMEALASNQTAPCYVMKCYESNIHEGLTRMFRVRKLQGLAKPQ